ncbi:hypothetical protein QAD02_019784 [Eretmocerus hayati]|uniref:Uncharacterized protein n=1 Tax=Eretmocerus hayati TaxID=131215 RepID=A0ACC2PKV2_9HYME|nr:hypothetical protein QAD02_019784 [Eretmocerus hayati]
MRQLREVNEAQLQQIADQAQEIAVLRARMEVTQAQMRHMFEMWRDSTSVDQMTTPDGHVDASSMNPLEQITPMQNADPSHRAKLNCLVPHFGSAGQEHKRILYKCSPKPSS